MLKAEDEHRSLECKLRYTQNQLERVKKRNAYTATFSIWHSGHFATINGFRLGRLPSEPVEWEEVNAAYGHTAFLLVSLAKAIGMNEFQRYQIVPYANFSYVKSTADGKTYPLHGTGGIRMMLNIRRDRDLFLISH